MVLFLVSLACLSPAAGLFWASVLAVALTAVAIAAQLLSFSPSPLPFPALVPAPAGGPRLLCLQVGEGELAASSRPAPAPATAPAPPASRLDPEALIVAARELLLVGWCQGAFARDARGEAVNATAPEAAAWSVVGALYRAATEAMPRGPIRVQFDALDGVLDALCCALPPEERHQLHRIAVARWSDAPGRTVGEVLELLDRTLAAGASGRVGGGS
jgi:hypothetical protein